jgi:hypothetical protein
LRRDRSEREGREGRIKEKARGRRGEVDEKNFSVTFIYQSAGKFTLMIVCTYKVVNTALSCRYI